MCNRCTVAGLTCTYSTGRPVGKPKGHRKSKSCTATISQSASPDKGSPPLPSMHAADNGLNLDGAHSTLNVRSPGSDMESPAVLRSGDAGELAHVSSGLPADFSGGDLISNSSPGNTSQLSYSTASPYEPSMPQAGLEDTAYFTTTSLSENGWIEPTATPAWPMPIFPAALLSGSSSDIAEIPAFCAGTDIDHQWLLPTSIAPNTTSMLSYGNGTTPPCQCSMLLYDIASLFRCQTSLPRANFDQVMQVVSRAVQKGQASLECYGCAAHGLSAVCTNIIVLLQQAVVCLQTILTVIDSDAYSAAAFGMPHGVKFEGYHLGSTDLKRQVVHTMIEQEFDGMQHLAHSVGVMAQAQTAHGHAHAGIMTLLAVLDEALEALRRNILPPAQS